MTSNEPNMPRRILRRAGNLLTSTGEPSIPVLRDVVLDFDDNKAYANDLRTRSRSEPGLGASIKRKLKEVNTGIGSTLTRNKSTTKSISSDSSGKDTGSKHGRSLSAASAPTCSPETNGTFAYERQQSLPRTPSVTHDTLRENPEMESGEDVKVPLLLQQGTPMTKVSAKKKKTVVFKIDPDEGCIMWESKKSGRSACKPIHSSVSTAMLTLS